MKKVFSIVMGLALVASLASCKKDHTCTCKVNGVEANKITYKDTKKKAKEACEKGNETVELLGTKIETKCSLD